MKIQQFLVGLVFFVLQFFTTAQAKNEISEVPDSSKKEQLRANEGFHAWKKWDKFELKNDHLRNISDTSFQKYLSPFSLALVPIDYYRSIQ